MKRVLSLFGLPHHGRTIRLDRRKLPLVRRLSTLSARGLVPLLLLAGCAGVSLEPGDGMLEVEGGSIFYRVMGTGSGVPLVLLHGGPGYSSHYLESLGALGDDRPVIAYDQLGGGRSDWVTDTSLFKIERYT